MQVWIEVRLRFIPLNGLVTGMRWGWMLALYSKTILIIGYEKIFSMMRRRWMSWQEGQKEKGIHSESFAAFPLTIDPIEFVHGAEDQQQRD